MPKPSNTSSNAKITAKPVMPVAQAAIAENTAETYTQTTRTVVRPLPPMAPKPTLWQRIWYGASAEYRMASRQANQSHTETIQAPLDEVKAGVLAEMQNISRTKGGYSGSPFANVMLPQGARLNASMNTSTASAAATQPTPTPKRRWGWLLWAFLVAGFVWLLLQISQWRQMPVAPAASLPTTTATELLPPPLQKQPSLADKPTVAKPIDLLAKPTIQLGQAALAEIINIPSMNTAPVGNSVGQMVFSTTVKNTSNQALQNLQLELKVDDMAGAPLLRRTLNVASIAANSAHSQRFVLSLLPNQPEALVATVPLRALKAHLVPLSAQTN